jgi:hypothetical protein
VCVYVSTHVCVCASPHECACVSPHVCVCVSHVQFQPCVCQYSFVCINMRLCVCVHTCNRPSHIHTRRSEVHTRRHADTRNKQIPTHTNTPARTHASQPRRSEVHTRRQVDTRDKQIHHKQTRPSAHMRLNRQLSSLMDIENYIANYYVRTHASLPETVKAPSAHETYTLHSTPHTPHPTPSTRPYRNCEGAICARTHTCMHVCVCIYTYIYIYR